MSRKKSLTSSGAPPITREEAERQAERVISNFRENRFVRRAILEALKRPERARRVARDFGLRFPPVDPSFRVKLRMALEREDWSSLKAMFVNDFLNDPNVSENVTELTRISKRQFWRKRGLAFADEFKGEKPGIDALVKPLHYPALTDRADSLRPVVFHILEARLDDDVHTLEEHLQFWSKRYPDGCQFLLRHVAQLRQLLETPELPKSAKKPKTQARIIADALAGVEYGLAFTTSIERVAQGRRMRKASTE